MNLSVPTALNSVSFLFEMTIHKHTDNYLVPQYKFLFLPTWQTQQMVKNGSVRLRIKQRDR